MSTIQIDKSNNQSLNQDVESIYFFKPCNLGPDLQKFWFKPWSFSPKPWSFLFKPWSLYPKPQIFHLNIGVHPLNHKTLEFMAWSTEVYPLNHRVSHLNLGVYSLNHRNLVIYTMIYRGFNSNLGVSPLNHEVSYLNLRVYPLNNRFFI